MSETEFDEFKTRVLSQKIQGFRNAAEVHCSISAIVMEAASLGWRLYHSRVFVVVRSMSRASL